MLVAIFLTLPLSHRMTRIFLRPYTPTSILFHWRSAPLSLAFSLGWRISVAFLRRFLPASSLRPLQLVKITLFFESVRGLSLRLLLLAQTALRSRAHAADLFFLLFYLLLFYSLGATTCVKCRYPV